MVGTPRWSLKFVPVVHDCNSVLLPCLSALSTILYLVNFVFVPYRLRAGSGSTLVVCLVVCAVLWNSLLVNNLLPHSRASGVSVERESDIWIISLGYG